MGAVLSALRKWVFGESAMSARRGPAWVAAERQRRRSTRRRRGGTPEPVRAALAARSATKRQRTADRENSVWAQKAKAQAAWAAVRAKRVATRSKKSQSLLPRHPLQGLEVRPKGAAKSRSGSGSYINHPHLNLLGAPAGMRTVRVRRGATPKQRSAPKTVSANKRHLVIQGVAPAGHAKAPKIKVVREN
jgi:hypothetical protein